MRRIYWNAMEDSGYHRLNSMRRKPMPSSMAARMLGMRADADSARVVWEARTDPKGKARQTSPGKIHQALRLQGQYFDEESGLHYNRFRYFDPDTGSYISPDPVDLAGGLNPYEFAPNVFGWIDPMGLNKINSILGCADGSTLELPTFKATPGAKKVIGRTEDAEQKLLRHVRETLSKSELRGSVLTIQSESTFVTVKGKVRRVDWMNPCDDCIRVMAEFAQKHEMTIRYKCRTTFEYKG